MENNIIYGFGLGIMLIIVPSFSAWVVSKLYAFLKSILFDK